MVMTAVRFPGGYYGSSANLTNGHLVLMHLCDSPVVQAVSGSNQAAETATSNAPAMQNIEQNREHSDSMHEVSF